MRPALPRSAAALLLLLAAACLCAQESPPAVSTPPAAATPPAITPVPPTEEYTPDEFAPWLRDWRRGEVIMFGSFPISLFLCFEVYDLYRFLANDYQIQYAPWPLRPANAALYTSGEKAGLLLSAVSISILLATADYLIGRAHERRTADARSSDR